MPHAIAYSFLAEQHSRNNPAEVGQQNPVRPILAHAWLSSHIVDCEFGLDFVPGSLVLLLRESDLVELDVSLEGTFALNPGRVLIQ